MIGLSLVAVLDVFLCIREFRASTFLISFFFPFHLAKDFDLMSLKGLLGFSRFSSVCIGTD